MTFKQKDTIKKLREEIKKLKRQIKLLQGWDEKKLENGKSY